MKSCIEKDSRKERIKKFYESWIELKLFQFNKEEDPTYESWKETFEKIDFSEYDVVYTSSFWWQATLKYLYDNNIKLKRLVMSVPWRSIYAINWKHKNNKKILDYLKDKNLENIAEEIIVISAKDDEVVPYESWKEIANITKAKFILLEKWWHKLEWHLDLIISLVKW